jgi:hypothetical protein
MINKAHNLFIGLFLREVLGCASPLALFVVMRAGQKRQRAAAVQEAIAHFPLPVVYRKVPQE